MRIFIICFFFFQFIFSQNISHYNIQTSNAFIKKVKIIEIEKSFIILEDSTNIPLTDISSLSSFLDVNIVYPTIAGGICGYTGGICGLILGTLMGFEFYEDGPRWTNKKQSTSLYIGLGLGFIYGYKKFLNFLLKKSEIFTDMDNWSDDEKYQFFRQMLHLDQNIIEQRDSNVKKKKSLSL
tara:strand:- start:58 stop:600 length:543 start_codon:yes stop_codon:yes gene_type:complete